MTIIRFVFAILLVAVLADTREASAQVLDKQKQLEAQSFWDNRDWDWYAEQIPFFECPDADITTTYYYRWELLTKHLTYGSPNSGYSFTEFIDRPFWSGAYGAISCPAGHQLYEARWLRQPRIARDYLKYWFRTPGAQPRNYSTWLADSAWAVNKVHRDDAFAIDLLPDLVKNYEGWEQRHFVPEVGLFWQTGHDDGMEFNINSRQTKDILRGAPSYRPSFNAYMWADAVAITKLARLAGKGDIADRFEKKAESLKTMMLKLLWDDQRKFFFPVYKNDEERDGHKIKALTKTYEDGQFAGDSHGRELIGYVPWQFNMIDRGKGYEAAWSKLMNRDGFYSGFGPSTVERNDPMFLLQKSCCWWSGQSWPYATTQTLKALANVVQRNVAESLRDSDSASRSAAATDADVKAAVARSLPFLEKQGLVWMEERDCMSCHHIPFMLWSHRAALRHGLTVDAQKLAEWEAWCQKDSIRQRNLYRLQKYELGKVAADKLPMSVRDKLTPLIDKPSKTSAEFIAALKPLLTEDELKSHQEILLKTAERPLNHPDRSGGGLDVVGQLLLGSHGSSSELAQPDFSKGLVGLMQELQRPDGSWMPGNQLLTMRRMTVPTADQVTTMWAAVALVAYGEEKTPHSAAIEKAVAFVRQQSPEPNNHEWLATRLIFEKQFGSVEDVAKLRQQLLSVRHVDGGWGWEKDQPSDPLTTGLAIYALAKVGGDHSAIFREARRYLLAAQHADGSWPTPAKSFTKTTDPERLKVRDEIYHYWGTGWAAIGLLETLNVTESLRDSASVSRSDASTKLPITRADYVKLLTIYAKSHRKYGQPYLAEALHPDTGSFEGHDGYNHSEHYFHSGYCDLVITGLVGLTPRDDETLEVNPLAPAEWDYFALDDVPYRGHRVSIVWDKTGERYKLGAGLHVLVDGKEVAKSDKLERLVVEHAARVPGDGSTTREPRFATTPTNFVVNNDGTYFPRLTASYSSPKTSISKLNDGNLWYVPHPPNRWTCEGSPNERDWVVIDFGVKRTIHAVKLYLLDDSGEKDSAVRAPQRIELEAWINDEWRPIKSQNDALDKPQGHRANVVKFDSIEVTKLRVTLHHRPDGKSGLSEIEAWGDVQLPLEAAPPPAGNLAYNPKPDGFPKASASFTDRFGGKPSSAIDGKTVFLPTPMNRWTSYESKSENDWLEIDFGREVEFRRVELAIYDDRGGVQPPTSYVIQHWAGTEWRDVSGAKKSPEQPLGSQWNEARFDPVKSSKARIVFTHRGQSRSGVSEVLIWND